MLRYAVELMRASKPPTLINDGEMAETLKRMACTEDIARDAMYGRCLGFQVCEKCESVVLLGNFISSVVLKFKPAV